MVSSQTDPATRVRSRVGARWSPREGHKSSPAPALVESHPPDWPAQRPVQGTVSPGVTGCRSLGVA